MCSLWAGQKKELGAQNHPKNGQFVDACGPKTAHAKRVFLMTGVRWGGVGWGGVGWGGVGWGGVGQDVAVM